MRQAIIAALVYFLLQLFLPHFWEQFISKAPPLLQHIVVFLASVACVGFVAFSDPIYERLRSPSLYPFSSTALFGVLVLSVAATAWWQFCVSTSPSRDVDLAEVANTTKFQEAFIIDTYNDVSATTYQKGEIYTTMTKLQEQDPVKFAKTSSSMIPEIQDLINRGLAVQTKTAQKKAFIPRLGKEGVQLNNVFLTRKGRELAEDLLYVRRHPELNMSRPQE